MQNKEKLQFVFVVLVYKNIEVLKNFFVSLNIENYKVIVVNSYYDDATLNECENVARQNGADFIAIENKGYGYGNNMGAKYAMEHYEYDYLILSNSDVHILDFTFMKNLKGFSGVLAPRIQMLTGKMQNPNIPWQMKWRYKAYKIGYDHNWGFFFHVNHVVTRLSREIFLAYSKIVKKSMYKIFCCHGSFIIFSGDAVQKLFPFFDDRMFLYNEEGYLAFKCKSKKINIYFCPEIKIEHLEGASTNHKKGASFNVNKQSFEILYDHICKNDF